MDVIKEISVAEIITIFAKTDFQRWELLRGVTVLHRSRGPCNFSRVEDRPNGPLLFFMVEHPPGKTKETPFEAASFHKYFRVEDVPVALPKDVVEDIKIRIFSEREEAAASETERIRLEQEKEIARLQKLEEERLQALREAASRSEFQMLKLEHNLSQSRHHDPTSPLFGILLKVKEHQPLKKSEIDWLKLEEEFEFLATYHEKMYGLLHDPWDLINACANLRKMNKPETSIELTEGVRFERAKEMSALLTTRGGAFKDLEEYDEALECAKEALRINERSRHVHSLLGGIYYHLGNADAGYKSFQRALELGGKPQEEEQQLRQMMESKRKTNREVIEFLLSKDPVKYEWAEHYLK